MITPPSRERLIALIQDMGITARDLLREKGTPYLDLGLDNLDLPESDLIEAMLLNPILINRPIVVTPRGVRLCRPSELILPLLENQSVGFFVKEDGEVVRSNK